MIPSKISRKSLSLTERDLADLEKLRASEVHRSALGRLVAEGDRVRPTDASVLHAVFLVGMKTIREYVEEEGYRTLAEEYEATREERKAVRDRRPSYWDAEA